MATNNVDYFLYEAELDNGLRVVVNEDPLAPGVDINLWYDVGSADEAPGMFGFAHLFEHMMFQGSSQVEANEHLSMVQSLGGNCNATTSYDRTNYFETLPLGAFDLGLWLEADRMASLMVTQENLDTQREVVKEEKRQRYDNVPYGDLLIELMERIFDSSHPYFHTPIGSMEDLDAASLQMAQDFYRQWYGPNNAVLTVVSPFSSNEVMARVKTYFGDIPPCDKPIRGGLGHPAQIKGKTRTQGIDRISKNVPATLVNLSWLSPPVTDPDSLALSIGLDVLNGGQSSRLNRHLVKETQLASSVSARDLALARGTSVVIVSAECRNGVDPEVLSQEILSQISNLSDEGPSQTEIDRALASYECDRLAHLGKRNTRADEISRWATLTRNPNWINEEMGQVMSLTPQDVQHSLSTYLAPDSCAVLFYEGMH